MIYIFSDKNPLLPQLSEHFKSHQIGSELVSSKHMLTLERVYTVKNQPVHAIIAEDCINNVHTDMWIDLLEGLAKRVPVLVISNGSSESLSRLNATALLTWLETPSEEAILNFLESCGALASKKELYFKNAIPVYSPIISTRMLKAQGFISILSIHAADFGRVALEYGTDVYQKLQHVLQKILYEMWGSSGAFRKSDILCRRAPNSNTFYILLDRSRSEAYTPIPGDLERLAERLAVRLENLMWQELYSASNERILPKFLEIVPRFIVSYASALYNPCVDSFTITEQLLRSCRDNAAVQDARMLSRQRELIQTLIQADHLLTVHYQGVFDLRQITPNQMKQLKSEPVLEALPESIYAFESLARVNKKQLQKLVGKEMSLNVDYLNPGVLFTRAGEVNLKLELDQACFRIAMECFQDLPGKLLVNILPRNFYFLDELRHMIPNNLEVIFEVSETEAINNMSLIQSIRDKISENDYGIAIDDFGKGYAGVDRIIKIRPNLIKLDQILISQIDQDKRMQAFVKGLVEAARSTQSLVLAEGVETYEELVTLAEIGIDLAQGFYLHSPEPQDKIIETLKRTKTPTKKKRSA